MPYHWNSSRPRSPLDDLVTIDLDLSSDELEPVEPPPKRRRGRPKAAPSSIEFEVKRAPPPEFKQAQACAGWNPTSSAGGCDARSEPSPPEDYSGFQPEEAGSVPEDNDESRKRSHKTPNDYLREWLADFAEHYLDEWYSLDAPPASSSCTICANETQSFHRCTTCIGAGIFCFTCLVASHRFNPTHRIKTWDGSSWVDDNLAREKLEYTLYLGHRGQPCRSNNRTWNLYVGDLNGFTPVRVRYCTCTGHAHRTRQLLNAGLFPCTHLHPESALTLPLLEMYDLLTTVGRTSGHKYYSVLTRFTSPGFPDKVEDRYRELMWTHRRFLYLLQLRLSGHGFPAHPDMDIHPGDQAIDCVACPRPGINFEWSEVPIEERLWFRLWFSFDGNARSVRKSKKFDVGDICLSDDKAYFALKGLYKEWTESVPQPKNLPKPVCDNHKAGKETSVRWVGRDVTGVGMFSCTSHTCVAPRGALDFFKGERFNYPDYGLGALISHISKRRDGPLLVGITYDVWCRYTINFSERIKLLPKSIAIPDDLDLTGAIPKWHLIGHERECFVRYSLDNKPYVGRLEGEGVERFWAHLNQSSGSTSEQGPGYRTDTINNIIRRWNEDKGYTMNETLPARYDDAKKMLARQKTNHEDLTATLPEDDIKNWEGVSTEPFKDAGGKWVSPLMDPVLENGGFQEAVRAERKKEGPTARTPGRRPGAARWLSDGIELEHNIRNYNDDAKEIGDSPTPRQANALNAKRLTLRDRVQEFLKRREHFMADTIEPDAQRLQTFYDEEEGVDLGMPSSYKPETIESSGLSSLAEVEKELRRAMCNEALESVKRLLGAKAQSIKHKRQHVRGQVATTRAEAAIRAQHQKVLKARWRYMNSYGALLALGASDSDNANYQELTESQLVPLKTYFQHYATVTGHGETTMSWIWRTSAAPNVDKWEVQALKTEWFRSRERYKRWEEQLVLLKREMVMTIRSFLRYQELWEWKSRCAGLTSGMRAYACGRAKFFGELASQMLVSSRKQLYDDTVELKWCTEWLRQNVIGMSRRCAAEPISNGVE